MCDDEYDDVCIICIYDDDVDNDGDMMMMMLMMIIIRPYISVVIITLNIHNIAYFVSRNHHSKYTQQRQCI